MSMGSGRHVTDIKVDAVSRESQGMIWRECDASLGGGINTSFTFCLILSIMFKFKDFETNLLIC
jgi:hypothetical protein